MPITVVLYEIKMLLPFYPRQLYIIYQELNSLLNESNVKYLPLCRRSQIVTLEHMLDFNCNHLSNYENFISTTT